MAEEQRRTGLGGIGDGIKTGIGMLSAFKEAVEETLQEAVERGDLTPERAKQAVRDAAQRMQGTLDEARERLEFVPRREFDELRQEVAELREQLARLQGGGAGDEPPQTPGGIIVTE